MVVVLLKHVIGTYDFSFSPSAGIYLSKSRPAGWFSRGDTLDGGQTVDVRTAADVSDVR